VGLTVTFAEIALAGLTHAVANNPPTSRTTAAVLMDHSRNVLIRGSSFRSDTLAAIVGTDEVKSEDRTCCDSMRFRLEDGSSQDWS
jgi:hypothetical protein